jgi:RimJ/RimL family protein N-acetyltransferase
VNLRDATLDDAELLFRWRNDPVTREDSHSQSVLEYESHLNWLKSTLHSERRRLFIAMQDAVPVGTIRCDWSRDRRSIELSWTVAPEHRRRGFGTKMVGCAISAFRVPLYAEIRVSNTPSIEIAKRQGFRQLETRDGGITVWRRDP